VFVLDVMLIAHTAAAGVKSLGILARSNGLFRDGICVLALSGSGSNIGDVASAYNRKVP
jgi:hypothetical protein